MPEDDAAAIERAANDANVSVSYYLCILAQAHLRTRRELGLDPDPEERDH